MMCAWSYHVIHVLLNTEMNVYNTLERKLLQKLPNLKRNWTTCILGQYQNAYKLTTHYVCHTVQETWLYATQYRKHGCMPHSTGNMVACHTVQETWLYATQYREHGCMPHSTGNMVVCHTVQETWLYATQYRKHGCMPHRTGNMVVNVVVKDMSLVYHKTCIQLLNSWTASWMLLPYLKQYSSKFSTRSTSLLCICMLIAL